MEHSSQPTTFLHISKLHSNRPELVDDRSSSPLRLRQRTPSSAKDKLKESVLVSRICRDRVVFHVCRRPRQNTKIGGDILIRFREDADDRVEVVVVRAPKRRAKSESIV